MTPSRILLNHEPKLYYAERISLRDFMARFQDAIAGEDKCAADDLLNDWRVCDEAAYRIGHWVFHGADSTRAEQQTLRDKAESKS